MFQRSGRREQRMSDPFPDDVDEHSWGRSLNLSAASAA
jgi:hypothetical protein